MKREGKTEKVQIMVEPSLIERIDNWRYTNRVASRSSAMRLLLDSMLNIKEAESAAETAISPR